MPSGLRNAARCPDCGATKQSAESVCWLCGVKVVNAPARLRPSPSQARDEGKVSTITTVAILVAMAAVCLGVWIESPGLGVAFMVLLTPGLVRMLYEAVTSRIEGAPLTLGEKIETLVRSTVAFAGILVTLAVASGVAFFVFCLYSVGGGGWH